MSRDKTQPDDSECDAESLHSQQPPSEHSWLSPPIVALTKFVLRFPVSVLALSIGMAIVCVAYTFTHMGYKSSRLDLLNPNSDYNRLWIEYINEFGDEDDAVIVVEGSNREQVASVLSELSVSLSKEQHLFHAILHKVDLSKIRKKGLYYLPFEQLQTIEYFLHEASPIINGQWSRLQVGMLIDGLSQKLQAASQGMLGINHDSALADLDRIVQSLLLHFSQAPNYQPALPNLPSSISTLSDLNSEYLLAKDGKLGFLLLRIAKGKDEFAQGSEAIDAMRALIAEIRLRYPVVKIGLTGLPIMENDEMRASQWVMCWASILSFVGVVVIVVAGFGGLRHALLANLVLLLGTAWAFGYATFVVGHLNILSITFTATLIGIGIDYGTYFVARYMQLRREGIQCEDALIQTARHTGPGITTGSVTMAVTFFAAALTSFTGVAELGLIAGGGILLCAISQLFVLPPCIKLIDTTKFGESMPVPLPIHTWVNPLLRVPRTVICGALLITIAAGWGIKDVWYDHNLLNMQPPGLESVMLERKLLSECDQSAWYAISVADSRKELMTRKAHALSLPSVERTEEIVSILPTDTEFKYDIIGAIANSLVNLPERPPLISIDGLEQLGGVLAQAQQITSTIPEGAACARRLELLRDAMRRLPATDCSVKLSQFQQQMAGELLSRLHTLQGVANPEPPQLNDLPQSLVSRFVGQNGKYLLRIYGRGDIWNMESLSRFVRDVRSVDPRATGNPLQAYEASLEMKQSYEQAAVYSFLIILFVLYMDFRNWLHVFLAILPLAVGIIITFGLLGFLNQPLNAANLIALPLLLGMGVDYGVHIVHEYLERPGCYRISPGTAVGLLVDSATTIIGYAGLMIASHQGLLSLGRVLTLGVAICTVTSMVFLPALLAWITRNQPVLNKDVVEPMYDDNSRFGSSYRNEMSHRCAA